MTGRLTSTTLPGLASNGQIIGNCWPHACTINVVPPTTPCGTITRYVRVVVAIDGSVGRVGGVAIDGSVGRVGGVGDVGDVGDVGGVDCCCGGFRTVGALKEEREDKKDLFFTFELHTLF